MESPKVLRKVIIYSTSGGASSIETAETDFNKILQQVNNETSIGTSGMKATLAMEGGVARDMELNAGSKVSNQDLVISFTPQKLKGGADSLDTMNFKELRAEFKSIKAQALQSDIELFNFLTSKKDGKNWTQFSTDMLRNRLKSARKKFFSEEKEVVTDIPKGGNLYNELTPFKEEVRDIRSEVSAGIERNQLINIANSLISIDISLKAIANALTGGSVTKKQAKTLVKKVVSDITPENVKDVLINAGLSHLV